MSHAKRAANGIEVAPVPARLVGAEPPDDLSPVAAEIWNTCVTDMVALGHLRGPDLLPLRGYCELGAVMIESAAVIREHGAMQKMPITAVDIEDGLEKVVGWKLLPNPAVKQHRDSLNAMRLMSGELGLNPLARIRGNLMATATASIAMGIKDGLEADLEAEDLALLEAKPKPRRKPAAKKPAPKRPPAAK